MQDDPKKGEDMKMHKALTVAVLFMFVIAACGSSGAPDVAVTVTGVTKTSVTTPQDGAGAVDVTFLLSSALSETAAPSITITGGASAGTCSVSADRTAVTCSVTGLSGCATFTDYAVTITGGLTEYSFMFNSADDEFTAGDTVTNDCYALQENASISDGKLLLSAGGAPAAAAKIMPDVKPDLLAVTYLSAFSSVLDHNASGFAFSNPPDWGPLAGLMSIYVFSQTGPDPKWAEIEQSGGEVSFSTMDTDIWPAAAQKGTELYWCLVHKSGEVDLYLSTDGASYTHVEPANMICGVDKTCIISGIPTADWPSMVVGMIDTGIDSAPNNSTSTYDFVRFDSSPSESPENDCAALTTMRP